MSKIFVTFGSHLSWIFLAGVLVVGCGPVHSADVSGGALGGAQQSGTAPGGETPGGMQGNGMPGGETGGGMAGGGMQGPKTCTVEADCQQACPPGAKGCACVAPPMGASKVCAPTCTTDTDCPKPPMGTVTCDSQQGICIPRKM